MIFLNKAINGKNESNHSSYICFSKRSKDLRSSKHKQLLPVERCRELSTSESFRSVCGFSNFFATREIDVFDSAEKGTNDLPTQSSPTFNLDRTCSWVIKCLCSSLSLLVLITLVCNILHYNCLLVPLYPKETLFFQ